MNKVYGKSDLQEILDLYANQDSRDEAIARAEQLLKDFANEDVDIEQSALEEFQKIIETFGITTNDAGEQVFTELGAQATARFQTIIDSLENAENAVDSDRILSLTSDQNQIKFDLVTLNVYKDMGLLHNACLPCPLLFSMLHCLPYIWLQCAQDLKYQTQMI